MDYGINKIIISERNEQFKNSNDDGLNIKNVLTTDISYLFICDSFNDNSDQNENVQVSAENFY